MARRVFNRLYAPEWPDTETARRRPWVASCGCKWQTFHASQRIAFGTAVRHTCPSIGFRRATA
jgi:hypothetical protein